MAFLNLLLILASIVLLKKAEASPPVNLTEVGEKDEEELAKIKKLRSLKQSDLTYTEDHNQFNLKVPKDAARVAFEVKGRGLPHREGRVLFTLKEGEYVKKIKNSKDSKWFMVQTYDKAPKRCWIPISAVKLATDKSAKSNP